MYLTKNEILDRLNSTEKQKRLTIRPLLSQKDQIGEMTIDFRLGVDFLVSNFGRESTIDVTGDGNSRPFYSLFSETRRLIGQPFTFYPHQNVLCSTIEYIKLPNDIFLTITPRSSYARLGFTLSTIVQPGYSGCISVELINTSSVPVKVRTGVCMFQARLFQLSSGVDYFSKNRKYYCQVRPQLSKAQQEPDIEILRKMANLD